MQIKTFYFFYPGIQLITSSTFLLESSYQIPLVDDSGINNNTFSF